MKESIGINTRLRCIKNYESLKKGDLYIINGQGYLNDVFVFYINDEMFGESISKEWWKLPYKSRVKEYYFTEYELNTYFLTETEYYKMIDRKKKLDFILKEIKKK